MRSSNQISLDCFWRSSCMSALPFIPASGLLTHHTEVCDLTSLPMNQHQTSSLPHVLCESHTALSEHLVMLQQHQFLSQMSPGSPMHGSSSLASAASMFHMSQSSGSPNFSYPYSHWYWPQPPMSPQAALLGSFMQTQYAASHTLSSGNRIHMPQEASSNDWEHSAASI